MRAEALRSSSSQKIIVTDNFLVWWCVRSSFR